MNDVTHHGYPDTDPVDLDEIEADPDPNEANDEPDFDPEADEPDPEGWPFPDPTGDAA